MKQQDADAKRILADLAEEVKRGECILFFGAGVHASPGKGSGFEYPATKQPLLGWQLTEEMAKTCQFQQKFPNEPLDLQRVSLCYETDKALGRARLVTFLRKQVQDGKEPSPALQMLAALPFKIITEVSHLSRERGLCPCC
jgi:hypothetical protein